MFVAMNRFRIARGAEADFEALWLNRDSKLKGVPGFIGFQLMRGPAGEDHTLFASYSRWESKAAFEAWTQSEAFRHAHKDAGAKPATKQMYLGPPQLETFEILQRID